MLKNRLVVLFVLAVGVWMQPRAQGQDIDIPYQKFVLENGLTADRARGPQGAHRRREPVVPRRLQERKGGKTGFAHLFEHLMFGGSQHAPGSYIKALENVGATDLNGTTNDDRTNFFEDVPDLGARLRVVDGVGPDGIPRPEPEDAGPAARRGAEREAARRERALRSHRGVHSGEHLSLRAPLLLGYDRRNGGPGRCLLQGRARLVQDVLRAVERGAGAGRRYRRQDGAGESGEIFWQHSRQDRR